MKEYFALKKKMDKLKKSAERYEKTLYTIFDVNQNEVNELYVKAKKEVRYKNASNRAVMEAAEPAKKFLKILSKKYCNIIL